MMELLFFESSLRVAIVGYVYSHVLTEPDMILSRVYKFLEEWLVPEFNFIFKPLIGCFRCVCGQIALWYFLFFDGYVWYQHIYFVCLTIFLSVIIDKIYQICRN